jgi:acyl-CoA reductase-like NAD-dependent aldehyde dehydrogenase/gamma-glutamyl-gamma-aminobutyrate hydrolase PuuD
MKKRIGISYTETRFQNYVDWFSTNDLKDDIELVELSFSKNNYAEIYTCDGFVLTGGIDLDPAVYGGTLVYANKPDEFLFMRDRFEEKIYRYSQTHNLPILAICRGLQLVNVLEGGKLIQDLSVTGNAIHRRTDQFDKEHAIHIHVNSLLHKITQRDAGNVNSAHHQAIDPNQLGENLMVSASSTDSTIEAIEFLDKSNKAFMLCVQWHPERMLDKENSPFSISIKAAFLSSVREIHLEKQSLINPATGKQIIQVNEDTRQSIQKKFDKLLIGKQEIRMLSLAKRIAIIHTFSELLDKNLESLAKVLTSEVGKPIQQSRNEINGARNRIKWLADHAEQYLSDEQMHMEAGLREVIRYEPLGIICNISAWNYPYLVGVNVFVPALLAGNAVMYKPSEYATLTGLEIEKLLKEAGISENAFQLCIGDGKTGEVLLDMPFDGYYFTGSYQTGNKIYQRVAKKMVPCQCEMGGKDPLYVAADIEDIAAVAAGTADGAFYNNGQSCCAVERIYVHENVYDAYIKAFVSEVNSWKTGSPLDQDTYIGALTRKEQLILLEEHIQDALAKGAKLLTGGKRIESDGFFFEPTVLTNVTHGMRVMTEESFGPVIGIMKVASDEEAIQWMQDTEYGLTAAVYSSDWNRAERILTAINAGTAYWNCCDRVSAALPWSGRKHSGFGVTLSHSGLRAFVNPKAYHLKS